MKLLATFGVLLFVSVPAHAQAAKPCEELKDEITKKLDARGVKGYTLEIVAKDKDAEGKTVGTCDGAPRRSSIPRRPPRRNPAKEPPSPNRRAVRPHTHRHSERSSRFFSSAFAPAKPSPAQRGISLPPRFQLRWSNFKLRRRVRVPHPFSVLGNGAVLTLFFLLLLQTSGPRAR